VARPRRPGTRPSAARSSSSVAAGSSPGGTSDRRSGLDSALTPATLVAGPREPAALASPSRVIAVSAPSRSMAVSAVVALVLTVGLTACGSSGPRASSSSSVTAAPGGSVGTATTDTTPPGATVEGTFPPDTATISATSSPLGTILVDGTGHTLYSYAADPPGVPTCTAACAKVWPPVTGAYLGVANTVAVQPGEFKLVVIPGTTTKQAAVDGHPLYRFSGDNLAGEIKGQGLDGKWYVVGPDGRPITKAAPATTTTR
jgi:predicted lipoprotein with Yx(FWY)xxD motif